MTNARLVELADRYGTPLYVYDLDSLAHRVDEFSNAFRQSNATIFFATMANDCPPILETLSRMGVGACVNSIPHLELALEMGFEHNSIQFTSTGITRDDLSHLRRLNIRVNLDSLSQLETWLLGGARTAGIRVNAASLCTQRPADRLGLDARELSDALLMCRKFGARLEGFHIYMGTNFQEHHQLAPTLEAFFALAARNPELRYVNIGGGIGVDYTHTGPSFDVAAYGELVAACCRKLNYSLGRDINVVVEPGRAMTASSGTFLTKVIDTKMLDGQCYTVVDASIAVFPRPFHHPDSPHRIRLLSMGDPADLDGPIIATKVVGRTTFSRDIIGSVVLPKLKVGDLLAVDDAGAYSQSMMSRFLGQVTPASVYVSENGVSEFSLPSAALKSIKLAESLTAAT